MLIKKIFVATIIFISILSCKDSESKKESNSEKINMPANHKKTKNNYVDLSAKAKKLTENWKEYQNIDDYIQQYKEISITNSLLNAQHLSELTQQLKDSIRIEKLNIPPVKIRLNVLHNEALRLADMATIKQITEEEVIRENTNILNAYSALNIKINNMVSQEGLNNEVKAFLEEVKKIPIFLDSVPITIDSIPH
jgi:hypothetical protein